MFGKNDMGKTEKVDTFIGENTVFEGNIESDGTIRVDGKVRGDIKVNGDVYIGSTAVVTGNIVANNVNLAGTIEGNINSRGTLRILSTAKLYGDILVHSFVADEGGIFQGKCSMADAPSIEMLAEKPAVKRLHSGRDYKKSSVISQGYDEKEKTAD